MGVQKVSGTFKSIDKCAKFMNHHPDMHLQTDTNKICIRSGCKHMNKFNIISLPTAVEVVAKERI